PPRPPPATHPPHPPRAPPPAGQTTAPPPPRNPPPPPAPPGPLDDSAHARSWQETLVRHPAATALGAGAALLGTVRGLRRITARRIG
ncbi:hypothetical protein ACWGKX_33120, partial [Streptomyces tricolor]